MENTLENKEKFFVQYWNQKVFNSDCDGWGLRYVDHNNIYPIDQYDYLELTPLSQITDEDAEACGYHSVEQFHKYRNQFEAKVDDAGREYDYLRSKGYALPFMGLSVEKQIEYGWIKLKTN